MSFSPYAVSIVTMLSKDHSNSNLLYNIAGCTINYITLDSVQM
jgi:hypothetical protein